MSPVLVLTHGPTLILALGHDGAAATEHRLDLEEDGARFVAFFPPVCVLIDPPAAAPTLDDTTVYVRVRTEVRLLGGAAARPAGCRSISVLFLGGF